MLPWFDNKFPLYLAPMAGYTDKVYRMLCKEHGADVLVSEFVLADALVREKESVWKTIDFTLEQRPVGIQIFGSKPDIMANAAKYIIERLNPDFIDLNFGCPATRITDICAGSSLLRDIPLLERIAYAVSAAAAPVPVTAKIRIGWDKNNIVALEVGKRLQDANIRALTIHGRTKEQGYSAEVDWNIINTVASSLKIPVVGNGNIRTVEDVAKIQAEGYVSGIMIGRAALGNPWLFQQIKTYLKTKELPPPPTKQERLHTLLRYAQLLIQDAIPQRKENIGWAKARLKTLIREIHGGNKIKQALDHITTYNDLEKLISESLSE